MAKAFIKRAIAGIGRITGNILPRPLNLVVIPTPLKPGHGTILIVYGRDVREVISGCGGLLAGHAAVDGECLAVVEKPYTDREKTAIRKLGTVIVTPRLSCWEQDGSPAVPHEAILFYPFPLTADEKPKIDELEKKLHLGSFYYQSRMLVLPEYQLCVDQAVRSKFLALHALGCGGELQLSQSAMAYGSAMAGGGRGWYESFISCDEGIMTPSDFVLRGEGNAR